MIRRKGRIKGKEGDQQKEDGEKTHDQNEKGKQMNREEEGNHENTDLLERRRILFKKEVNPGDNEKELIQGTDQEEEKMMKRTS